MTVMNKFWKIYLHATSAMLLLLIVMNKFWNVINAAYDEVKVALLVTEQ